MIRTKLSTLAIAIASANSFAIADKTAQTPIEEVSLADTIDQVT